MRVRVDSHKGVYYGAHKVSDLRAEIKSVPQVFSRGVIGS